MPKQLVIGVVGATHDATPRALDLAGKVGTLIGLSRHIVLTGGHHEGHLDEVKNLVLARAAANPNAPGIGIGILPKGERASNRPNRISYVATHMKSKRNALTGGLPDVLIAVQGGAGTISEIYFALHFNRPVVFLGWSIKNFRNDCGRYCEGVAEFVNDVAELSLFDRPFTGDEIRQELVGRLNTVGRYRSPQAAFEAAQLAMPNKRPEILKALAKSTPKWRAVGENIEVVLQSLRQSTDTLRLQTPTDPTASR